jgi:hypothetical protein
MLNRLIGDEIDFKPGDKVFLDFKFYGTEIKVSLGDIEINKDDLFEVSSVNGIFILIKELNKTLYKQYIKLACENCQKKAAFRKGGYRKCLSCARKERDNSRQELVGMLSDKQLSTFLIYEKACSDFSSMIIFD